MSKASAVTRQVKQSHVIPAILYWSHQFKSQMFQFWPNSLLTSLGKQWTMAPPIHVRDLGKSCWPLTDFMDEVLAGMNGTANMGSCIIGQLPHCCVVKAEWRNRWKSVTSLLCIHHVSEVAWPKSNQRVGKQWNTTSHTTESWAIGRGGNRRPFMHLSQVGYRSYFGSTWGHRFPSVQKCCTVFSKKNTNWTSW